MQIIADPETASTCMIKGCNRDAYTVVIFSAEEMHGNKAAQVTLCKKHFGESEAGDDMSQYTVVFL